MENYDKFNFIKVKKLKTPKRNRNNFIKSFKKEFTKTIQDLEHKKIKIKPKSKKQHKIKEIWQIIFQK